MVTSKRIPDVRGEVLKKAREARGISVSELATKVCFSVKQIEQLENGEKSHFYSLAIKANAAKRVADELGVKHEDTFDFGPDLVEESKTLQSTPVDPLAGVETKNENKDIVPVSEFISKPQQLERFQEPNQPAVKKNLRVYFLGGAAVIVSAALILINMNQESQPTKPVEVAKLPSETITNSADSKKEELAPTAPSPSPTAIAAVAATPSQVADGCPVLDVNIVSYRSPIATKPGNMVYVQTRSAQTICVKDATGKFEKRAFDPGGSHSFFGKAPFVVMTSSLGQTDIFFQGYKVKIDNPNAKSINLEEVAF